MVGGVKWKGWSVEKRWFRAGSAQRPVPVAFKINSGGGGRPEGIGWCIIGKEVRGGRVILAMAVVRGKQGVHTTQPAAAADDRPANVFAVFFDHRRRRWRCSLSHYSATSLPPRLTLNSLPPVPPSTSSAFPSHTKTTPSSSSRWKEYFPFIDRRLVGLRLFLLEPISVSSIFFLVFFLRIIITFLFFFLLPRYYANVR